MLCDELLIFNVRFVLWFTYLVHILHYQKCAETLKQVTRSVPLHTDVNYCLLQLQCKHLIYVFHSVFIFNTWLSPNLAGHIFILPVQTAFFFFFKLWWAVISAVLNIYSTPHQKAGWQNRQSLAQKLKRLICRAQSLHTLLLSFPSSLFLYCFSSCMLTSSDVMITSMFCPQDYVI